MPRFFRGRKSRSCHNINDRVRRSKIDGRKIPSAFVGVSRESRGMIVFESHINMD